MAAILFVRTSISYYLCWRHLWVGGDWNISGCFARVSLDQNARGKSCNRILERPMEQLVHGSDA